LTNNFLPVYNIDKDCDELLVTFGRFAGIQSPGITSREQVAKPAVVPVYLFNAATAGGL
jgi:hypothetical protein